MASTSNRSLNDFRTHCAAKAKTLTQLGDVNKATVAHLLHGTVTKADSRTAQIARIMAKLGYTHWNAISVAEAYTLNRAPDDELRRRDPAPPPPTQLRPEVAQFLAATAPLIKPKGASRR